MKVVAGFFGLVLVGLMFSGCGSDDSSDSYTDYTGGSYGDTSDSSDTLSPSQVDALGEEICDALRNGLTRAEASQIFYSAGISPEDGAQIMVSAVAAYCPDQEGNL